MCISSGKGIYCIHIKFDNTEILSLLKYGAAVLQNLFVIRKLRGTTHLIVFHIICLIIYSWLN